MNEQARTIDDTLAAQMLRATLIALCAAVLSSPLRAESGDTARYLRDLSSPSGEVRAEAGRWLARHLSLADLDAVLACAARGDAESNRRLLEALSDDDRNLELAVALATRTEERAAETGRGAIGELAARWQGGLDRAGMSQEKLFAWLAERTDEPLTVGARGRSVSLFVALDELARFSPATLGIALAPELDGASDPRKPRGAITGRLDTVLADLATYHGVRIEGFGIDDELADDAQPWIHVYSPAARKVARTGRELLTDWCVAAAGADGRGAARALVSTGWPAAIQWFESRWRGRSDPVALDALLLAARRGRVAPALLDREVQRDLYARMSRASLGGSPAELSLAQDIARAVASTGPSGLAGVDLASLALDGFSAAPPRERWLRLVVLEGHARGAAEINAIVTAPPSSSIPPALRFQALRARAAACRGSGSDSAILAAAGGRELLEWLDVSGLTESALPALCDSRTRPSEDVRDPHPLKPGVRAAALEWWFAAAERDTVAEHVGASKAPLDVLAAHARRWVREGHARFWRECLEAARHRSGANGDAIDLLAIQSGAADEKTRARWLDRWITAPPTARDELMALAALAASDRAPEVCAALVEAMRGAGSAEDVADALSAARLELVAARREEDERAFVKAERAAVKDAPDPLRERLRSWPGRPAARPRITSDFDRRLELTGP